jgi:hypothetical protein
VYFPTQGGELQIRLDENDMKMLKIVGIDTMVTYFSSTKHCLEIAVYLTSERNQSLAKSNSLDLWSASNSRDSIN